MTLTPLALTAITNFILAWEASFLAGHLWAQPKARGSAMWWWAAALSALALSALLGGIDHGFFEPQGQTPPRKLLEHINWFVLGVLTALALVTAARQFLSPRGQRVALAFAAVQLAIYTGLLFLVDSFLLVLANYAPVMLLLLGLSVRGLRTGLGSWPLIIGIGLAFGASGVQAAGVDVFLPFDRNSLYHFGMMAAVIFLYLGGRRLKTD